MDLAQAPADLQWDLLASRQRVSQSLSTLRSMIDICKLNTIEIFWLSSKIKEIFGVVETAAKIEELVDVKEQEVLREKEQIHKMREDLSIQQQSLIEVENKLKSSLDLKKRQAEKDLEKEKDHLKILIGFVISFSVRQRSKPLNARKELRKRARPRSAFRDWRRGVDYRAKGMISLICDLKRVNTHGLNTIR
ncbi:hypothetical protein Cgig2_024537 [Carnegiea gigantea]|uniref:Uncharacterized protein n=1 Tax=Carnegiea gigantea TaxID=171969 RepID=A0A9Q1JXP1_9CARY|nr:hypothetical protein Cgig2_024537 [Carnegiea gigantea]